MKNIRIIIFAAVAAVQLAVPVYLIANREYVLRTGGVYHFRTRPVDPYDAFRGRYVSLNYEFEDELREALKKKYLPSVNAREIETKKVYVTLKRDGEGFAGVDGVSETVPGLPDYLAVKVQVESSLVSFKMNFDRFYMDEFDAPEAESAYWRESSEKKAYTVVHVRNGQAVLKDLMIEDTPIREYLKKHAQDMENKAR